MKTIKVMTAVLLGFFSIITVGCSKELGIQKSFLKTKSTERQ
ncbi:MAG TPA: hypothetical protein PKM70_07420 [Clostridia bacterium]|nr:hypothetical protein [Clostridia bacterium]